ncbi:MAG: hypothetical protein P4L16_08330 [Chlamydiales bacterium]|nr:hypothetical protein [Chlamydiales bacterium]
MTKLSEKEFISGKLYHKETFSLWFCLVFLIVLIGILYSVFYTRDSWIEKKIDDNPFLQVTYREFSLFLWQNPEFMKINFKGPSEYLKNVKEDKIGILPDFAESYVMAPPEVLFRFHLWKELLGKKLLSRPIFFQEFQEFLQYSQEWTVLYWQTAPQSYLTLINLISFDPLLYHSFDLRELLPFEVSLAFQGWKNYFKEGGEINEIEFTYGEILKFLSRYPELSRSYWRNVLKEMVPEYLIYQTQENIDLKDKVNKREVSSLLKVYYYNEKMASLGL